MTAPMLRRLTGVAFLLGSLAGSGGAFAAAPADINGWVGEQAQRLAREMWPRLPASVTQAGYGNQGAFVGDAHAFGRALAPELRAQVGLLGPGDFDRTKEGVLVFLGMRMDGYAQRYASRVRTVAEVMSRFEQARGQIWDRLPGEARGDNGGYNAEFSGLKAAIAGDIWQYQPGGSTDAAAQKATVAWAFDRAAGFAKGYAERKINERRAAEESAERARRQPEYCWRTWQTCWHNIFKPHTEKYDCKWIFCKLRTTYPWECTDHGANDLGCLARNAWKAATGWFNDLWGKFTGFVQNAWGAISSLATTVWNKVQEGAKWVAEKATEAAKWAGDQLNKIGGVLKRIPSLNLADLFADPVGFLFKALPIEELLEPAKMILKPLADEAARRIQELVDKAIAGLDSTFTEKLLIPAARWALEKIFGSNVLAQLQAVCEKVVGDVAAEARRMSAVQRALAALTTRDLGGFDAASLAHRKEIDALKVAQDRALTDGVVGFVKRRLSMFIQAKGTTLLRAVLKILETPLQAGRVAICSAISAIPAVGSALAMAASHAIKAGLVTMRNLAADFLAKTATRVFVVPFLDKLDAALRGGGVSKFEAWVAKILDPVLPSLATVRREIGRIISAHETLSANLLRARKSVADQPAAAAGGGR